MITPVASPEFWCEGGGHRGDRIAVPEYAMLDRQLSDFVELKVN